jgi:hypothetical protein
MNYVDFCGIYFGGSSGIRLRAAADGSPQCFVMIHELWYQRVLFFPITRVHNNNNDFFFFIERWLSDVDESTRTHERRPEWTSNSELLQHRTLCRGTRTKQ